MNKSEFLDLLDRLRGSSVITLRQLAERLEEDSHGLWRLGVLLDVAEFCIKFRAIYSMAECLRAKIQLPGKIGTDFKRPTLGDWTGVLRDGSDSLRKSSVAVFNPDLLTNESLEESIKILVDARNSRAHGATISSTEGHKESGRIIPHLLRLIEPFASKEWELLSESISGGPKIIEEEDITRWRPYILQLKSGHQIELFPWLVEEKTFKGRFLLMFNRDNQTDAKVGPLDYLNYSSGEERDLSTEYRGAVQDALKFFKLASYGPNWQSHVTEKHRLFYVERDSESAVLRDFISGTSRVQVIFGHPGFGKTALLAQFVRDHDPIRHFVTVVDDTTREAKKILKNLHDQLKSRREASQGMGRQNILNEPDSPSFIVLIDGLDEAKDLGKLFEKLRDEKDFQEAKFIFGCQSHVVAEISQFYGEASVVKHRLSGLTLPETKELAELFELRLLSDTQLEEIHKRTKGGPLFLRSLFRDLGSGVLTASELESMPSDVEQYWEDRLEMQDPKGTNQVRQVKRIATKAFQTILDDWSMVPPERDKLSQSFGKEVDRVLRSELTVLLGILAHSQLPLSVRHLQEIISTTDEQFVPKALLKLGSLIDTQEQSAERTVQLCHASLSDFLQRKHVETSVEAKTLLYTWSRDWRADSSGLRARVFGFVCQESERISSLNDWAFFKLYLTAWGLKETAQLYESDIDDGHKRILSGERLRRAFRQLPPTLVADMNSIGAGQASSNRGGARVIKEHEFWQKEQATERERQASTYDSTSALDHHHQRESLEKERKKHDLPMGWFGDWTSCEDTLSAVREGYFQAFDAPPSTAESPTEGSQSWRFAELLDQCKWQLSKLQADVPLIAYNSGIFRNTLLDAELRGEIVRGRPCWIEREHRHPTRPFADSEVRHAEIGHDFILATGSPVICYSRISSHTPETFELVSEDIRDGSTMISQANESLHVLCLSFNGQTAIVKVSESCQKRDGSRSQLVMFDLTSGKRIREIFIQNLRKFSRLFDATPDLGLLLVDLEGQVALVNSRTGETTEFPLGGFYESGDNCRLSRDGSIALIRAAYGYYTVFSTFPFKILNGGGVSTLEKRLHSTMDPTGRLFLDSGRLYSIPEQLCVRDFEKSRNQDCATFSMDSRILVIASGPLLRAYDVRLGRQIGEYPLREPCSEVVMSGDGSLALLKTHSDNLLVIDLLKSGVPPLEALLFKAVEPVVQEVDDHVAFFWNERNERLIKCWNQQGGVSTLELDPMDFDLSGCISSSGQYQGPKPVFKTLNEVWFGFEQQFQYSIFRLDQWEFLSGVFLLDDSAPLGLTGAIQEHLSLFQAANQWRYFGDEHPKVRVDANLFPIDGNFVAVGIFPNILAVLDVSKRSIVHWRPWGKPGSSAMDLIRLCANSECVYALTSNNELLTWNWKEGITIEVLRLPLGGEDWDAHMELCGSSLVIRLLARCGVPCALIYDCDSKQFIEKSIHMENLQWGAHSLAIVGQTQFLVSLDPLHADLGKGRHLALVDLDRSCIVASICFESPIAQLFRLGTDAFGVALEDGTFEAVRTRENLAPNLS